MRAETHTEIYRPFEGELRPTPLRFLAIAGAVLRVSFKKKLPLLLLYVIPFGTGTVTAFIVHTKYTLEAGLVPGLETGPERMIAMAAGKNIEVSQQIVSYLIFIRFFALLPLAWFGAGLIAEDRRVGAHLLYFSRPLSRLDYFLGKFLGASFFGVLALLTPVLVICCVAAFSSPEWSFVKEQGHVIGYSILFCLGWIASTVCFVLAVSSLVERKTMALVGVIGASILTVSSGLAMTLVTGDERFHALSPLTSSQAILDWLFERSGEIDMPVSYAWASILIVTAASLIIVVQRLRRVEVVG